MTKYFLIFIVALMGINTPVFANPPKTPPLPEPIATLQKDGAQLKYLGRDLGFDGWIAIKNGQEQYFYVTPDGSAFFLGVLFNKNGRAVTFDQMKRLQGVKDPALNNLENAPSQIVEQPNPAPATPIATTSQSTMMNGNQSSQRPGSPAEQLMQDVMAGYSFTLGKNPNAPTLYMFTDPLCPHCKDMIQVLNPALARGDMAVKVLMVGALTPDSAPLAAGILSQNNPGESYNALIYKQKLPPKGNASDPRIAKNLDIMMKWKFTGTPVTVYRAKNGAIKILQGPPKSLDILMQDLR